jgi:hypothetical protein
MNSESTTQARERAAQIWRQSRDWIIRLSLTARIMLGLFLFAALLVALHTAFSAKNASLHLTVQHGFRSADISLWVDGDSRLLRQTQRIRKEKIWINCRLGTG